MAFSLRRHPTTTQLEGWFDGEASEGLAWHIATCGRCFTHVNRIARIRALVRGEVLEEFEELDDLEAELEPDLTDFELASVFDDSTQPDERGDWAPPATGTASLDDELVTVGHALSGISDDVGGNRSSRRRSKHDASQESGERSARVSSLIAVPAAAVLAVLGLAVATGGIPIRGALSSNQGIVSGSGSDSGGSSAGDQPVTSPGGSEGSSASNASTTVPMGSAAGVGRGRQGVGSPAGSSVDALRLGLIVPTSGADSAEGAEVERAARQAIEEANAQGGVGGNAVQLIVAASEGHPYAILSSSHVAALVGGFDAPPSDWLPWVLPADPSITGSRVIPTELSAREAGSRLGAQLIHEGFLGKVGVVVGSGGDAAMAIGIAEELPTVVTQASPDGTCATEIQSLQSQHVDALAVAGPPADAFTCLADIDASGWKGPVLLPPSAAYSSPGSVGLSQSSPYELTVLGLPWPGSPSPGAQRFRSEVPGVTSYRALVTFAAVEMAVQVARAAGTPTPATVNDGHWQNDLFDYVGETNAGARVVQATASGWNPAPSSAPSTPSGTPPSSPPSTPSGTPPSSPPSTPSGTSPSTPPTTAPPAPRGPSIDTPGTASFTR